MRRKGGEVWEHSSAGRASALQAGGHRFEPCCSHQLSGPVVQSVSTPACHAGGRRFESVPGRHIKLSRALCSAQYASVAQSVEQWTENPRVVGSIPTGGTRCGCSSSGRAPPCQGGGSEFEPRHPLQTDKERKCVPYFIRYLGQVVRQESAKLSFPSSNLGGTSKKESTPLGVLSFLYALREQKTQFCEQSEAESSSHF